MMAVVAALALLPAKADAAPSLKLASAQTVAQDVTRLTYRYGPLVAGPGSNYLMVGPEVLGSISAEDAYLIRTKPGLVDANGKPPPVDELHMHHAVLLNLARPDATAPTLPGERFFGFAEEKTIGEMPAPYGYFMRPQDPVAISYMLHNGTQATESVWIELEVDLVAAASDLGKTMKPVRPLWIDVENGKAYPVFDVHRGAGGGRWEYPDDAPGAYSGRARLNEWVADRDGVLVAGAGHLHPGGLWVDLRTSRGGRRADLFRSEAVYFDPNGPVSWDMAMTVTPRTWRAAVRKGDVLSVHTTYETQRASWYESMGLFLVYMADAPGPDPFTAPPATRGDVTHGHLPEAGNHGGQRGGAIDPAIRPDGAAVAGGVGIANFLYRPGDLSLAGDAGNPPVAEPGQALTFGNFDAAAGILHTVTACRAPCTGVTGVSYPLADADVQFDSGQLGFGPPDYTAAAQKPDWKVPKDLDPGTYSYFCRVHPFMRGAFRVAGTPATPPGGNIPTGAAGPRLHLRGGRLALRRGRVRVGLRCAGASGTCAGVVRIVAAGHKPRVLARARYRLVAGRSRSVSLRLTRGARQVLRRSRRGIRVRVQATPDRGRRITRLARLR
jgi:plastocyanin